ncbi:MAG TPA: alpha/beta hydrolase [Deltaproteobacteria bacterium]|nr:alpha/beta hydrolase [Deltaproteobacteria bacterium]
MFDRDENKNHPYASPLLAENLSNLPPALIIVAEFDVLRDECLAYADRLKKAGIPVTCLIYDDMIHAFLNLSGAVDRSREAIEDMCDKLRKVFS